MAPRWTHTIYQVMEDKGQIIAYFLSFDIDEYKRSKDLVRQMAERDSLTGLYNRHTAVPLIRNRLYRHQSGKSALIMVDIDDFRKINDEYGTFAGDEVLRRISARLDDLFGRDGIVCHIDQDEFLIFVEDDPIICHNASFDINFLQEKLRQCQYPLLKNKIIDTLPLARKKISHLKGYKLIDIAEYYEIGSTQLHRALPHCQLTLDIFLRLNPS